MFDHISNMRIYDFGGIEKGLVGDQEVKNVPHYDFPMKPSDTTDDPTAMLAQPQIVSRSLKKQTLNVCTSFENTFIDEH